MKMVKEMYNMILDELTSRGKRVEIPEYEDFATDMAAKILAAGYVRYDTIDLDPQKCVQLLAVILNGFKEERPFAVIEKEDEEK